MEISRAKSVQVKVIKYLNGFPVGIEMLKLNSRNRRRR